MAKYGTFMSPDLFGSKFFMGTVVKKYAENPLHFLMGEYVTERDLKRKAISVIHGLLNADTKYETVSGALSFLENINLKDFTDVDWHC